MNEGLYRLQNVVNCTVSDFRIRVTLDYYEYKHFYDTDILLIQ